MGVTKKPVVAKTTPKIRFAKRGRPVGSKNKPKLPSFPVPKKVNWEELAKRLQEALSNQIKETQQYEKLVEEFQTVATPVSHLSFWQRVKLVITGKY
jgi:hypothetical protein